MINYFYPALFHKAKEGGFWITFPDFPECLTQGDEMQDAYEMAFDALGLCISDILKNKLDIPMPSKPDEIQTEKDTIQVVIHFNLDEYRKKHNSKAVKKTLTIPEWLNEEALKMNLNFSQVLQEALMNKIGI